jgi:hypothetical protein
MSSLLLFSKGIKITILQKNKDEQAFIHMLKNSWKDVRRVGAAVLRNN